MFTEKMLKKIVKEKLTLGYEYDAKSGRGKRKISSSIYGGNTLHLVKFYSHLVLFQAKNGFMETYTYWDVWQEFLGGNTCDFEGEVILDD